MTLKLELDGINVAPALMLSALKMDSEELPAPSARWTNVRAVVDCPPRS
jgi:hypothetical protein